MPGDRDDGGRDSSGGRKSDHANDPVFNAPVWPGSPGKQGTPGKSTRTDKLGPPRPRRPVEDMALAAGAPIHGPLQSGQTLQAGELIVRQLGDDWVIIELGPSTIEIKKPAGQGPGGKSRGAAEAYDFFIDRPSSEHQRLVRITATMGVDINVRNDPGAPVQFVVHQRRVDSPARIGSMPLAPMWLGGVGEVAETPNMGAQSDHEILIAHRGRHAHTLTVDGTDIDIDAPDPHTTYAFDLAPEWSGPDGRERMMHIVAMPGVRVATNSSGNEEFRENTFRRRLVPNVIRVQDPSRVPAQGTRIHPGDYVGRSIIPGIAHANPSAALDVATGNAGVTVRETFSNVSLRIYPKDAAVGARFAYEIVSPRQKREARGTTEIRALVAKNTRVEITEPRAAPPFGKDEIDTFGDHNVRLHIYEAWDPQKIPPQGTRLDDALLERLGTERAPDRRYRPPTTGQAAALAATDMGMSTVPGAGDVYDLMQFGKSALTGTDVQGRPVSDGELAIMGVAVLLPFLGAGVVRTAAKTTRTAAKTTRTVDALAGQLGRTADEIEVLLVKLDGLEPADQEVVRRIELMIEQGKRVDPDDIDHVLGKIEALGFGNVQLRGMDGMVGEPAAARSPWASLGEGPEVDAMHVAGKKPPRSRDPFVAIERDSAARVAFERLEKNIGGDGEVRVALAEAARHAAEIDHPAKYIKAVEALFKARPEDRALLARLIAPSTKAGDPAKFLHGGRWLADQGLSRDALTRLIEKIEDKGYPDPAWLARSRLGRDDLEFLALDPNTSWQSFMRASHASSERFPRGIRSGGVNAARANKHAYSSIRGAAAEIVENQRALPPGSKVLERQPETATGTLDFLIRDAQGKVRAVEVKSWRATTWAAYLAKGDASPQMRRLIEQLKGGYRVGTPPILVLSDAVDSSLLRRIRRFLDKAGINDLDIAKLPEAEILATAKRLRKAMNIK